MDLNPQQKSAVQAPSQPLLIVAGAGTGKTRTLTSRLLYLINRGVNPSKIIALTFTNKAAKEMAERVHNAKIANTLCECRENFSHNLYMVSHRSHCAFPFIGTFHSLGARILRAEARFLKRTSNFVIFDEADSLQAVKKIVKKFSGSEQGPAFYSQKISQIKDGQLKSADFKNSASPADQLILKIFQNYEKELVENNAFDFDDLIEKVVRIFKRRPEILRKYQRCFQHILIDEYQDLNNRQYELVRLLSGSSPNISVVGDDQQMIYGWRGSDINIFLNFENDWQNTKMVLLEENYRSTSNIIKAASALIKNNRYQKPKNLWTKNPDGNLIKIVEVGDEETEAEWIAEQVNWLISKLVNPNKENQNQLTSQLINRLTNIAVLYRTNAQSRALEQALVERGMPYQLFGGLKFYERREIRDLLAGLRYIFNPHDSLSRERLQKNLNKARFSRFQKALGENSGLTPRQLLDVFLTSTDYPRFLEKNFFNAGERLENIAELLRFAERFNDLENFLEQISLVQPTDDLAANGKSQIADSNKLAPFASRHLPFAVNLMTIHLAKGLEFDEVFVAGCSEGLLPHNRSLFSQAELEEERRLLYVAMTRTKKELCLSFYDLPSRFLSELPPELLEFQSQISDKKIFSDSEERYIALD